MYSLSFVQRTFGWGEETALGGEEGVENGAQVLTKWVCLKSGISRKTQGYFSTMDLIMFKTKLEK